MSFSAPRVDLFCLPCAGASATMYLRWRHRLPAWIQLQPVELPGRGSRLGEPFVESFQSLVDQLSVEISQRINGRWALFGHSMGALLAFGIASHLQSKQMSAPTMLFVSASPAPSRRDPDRFPDTKDNAVLIADLRKQDGTPQEVFDSPELLELVLDTLRADYRVCQSFDYVPGQKLAMPVQVFAGRQDDITPDKIEAWQIETNHTFALDWFDGGHFFFRQQEAAVLKIIEHSLCRTFEQTRRTGAIPA